MNADPHPPYINPMEKVGNMVLYGKEAGTDPGGVLGPKTSERGKKCCVPTCENATF